MRRLLGVIALVLGGASPAASALMLGEMEQLSSLGQAFRARVGFALATGEVIEPRCIRANGTRPDAGVEVPVLIGARSRIESTGGKDYIILESHEVLSEPILHVTLEVACDQAGSFKRDYFLLFDPRDSFVKNEVVFPALPERSSLPAPATLRSPEPNPAATAAKLPQVVAPSISGTDAGARQRTASASMAGAMAADSGKPLPSSAVPSPKPRPVARRDVLRLEAPLDEAQNGLDARGCCFRLSYELQERAGAPITEAERDRLRMEYAERMGEGEILGRLLALREQIKTLKEQAVALDVQVAEQQLRREKQERDEKSTWIAALILGAAAMAYGGWLWWRRSRREPFSMDAYGLYDTGAAASVANQSVEVTADAGAGQIPHASASATTPPVHSPPAAKVEVPAPVSRGRTDPGPHETVPREGVKRESPPFPTAAVRALEYPGGESFVNTVVLQSPPGLDTAPAKANDEAQDKIRVVETSEPAETFSTPQAAQDPGLTFSSPLDLELESSGESIAAEDFELPLDAPVSTPLDVSLVQEAPAFMFSLDDTVVDPGKEDMPKSAPVLQDQTMPPSIAATPVALDRPILAAAPAMQDDGEKDPVAVADRAHAYRQAYIADRFPEIAAGSIELYKPASVVEGARVMYQEDQDVARAVALLQLGRSTQPRYIELWLCLLEIFWLESMRAAYVDLAHRFQEAFSQRHPEWPMIAKLGREIDASNGLFRADGLPVVDESRPNWLNAQLDMMGHVLSNQLRDRVLDAIAGSGVSRHV